MKHSTTNAKKDNSISTLCIAAAAWLMLWQLCCVRINKPLLLPSPMQVLKTLLTLTQTGLFWTTVAASLGKILLAFGLAVLLGCLCCSGNPCRAQFPASTNQHHSSYAGGFLHHSGLGLDPIHVATCIHQLSHGSAHDL